LLIFYYVDIVLSRLKKEQNLKGQERRLAVLKNGKTIKDFCLKVNGLRSYLVRETPLIDYDYVRSCILRNVPVDLRHFLPSQDDWVFIYDE